MTISEPKFKISTISSNTQRVHKNSSKIDLEELSYGSNSNLSSLVSKILEPVGRYQIFVYLINFFLFAVPSSQSTTPGFFDFTPAVYSCASGAATNNNTQTLCTPGCNEYVFPEEIESSLVMEFNLICDNRYLMALSTSIYFIGQTFGSLICGIFSDIFGRKTTIVVSLWLHTALAIGVFFSDSFTTFTILRFFQGVFQQGLQIVAMTLMQELSPTRMLTITGIILEYGFSFGVVYAGVVAYFIQNWRWLHLVSNGPAYLTTFLLCWFLPESPKYFISKNRKFDAVKETYKIAKRNKMGKLFEDAAAEVKSASDINDTEACENSKKATFTELFTNFILIKHLVVMMIVYFSVGMAYYGVLYYIPNMRGSKNFHI